MWEPGSGQNPVSFCHPNQSAGCDKIKVQNGRYADGRLPKAMSVTEILLTFLFAGLVMYGFFVVWFRPDTVRYWVKEGRMFHGEPSRWEYVYGLWFSRFIVTLMLLGLIYMAGMLLVDWLRMVGT